MGHLPIPAPRLTQGRLEMVLDVCGVFAQGLPDNADQVDQVQKPHLGTHRRGAHPRSSSNLPTKPALRSTSKTLSHLDRTLTQIEQSEVCKDTCIPNTTICSHRSGASSNCSFITNL